MDPTVYAAVAERATAAAKVTNERLRAGVGTAEVESRARTDALMFCLGRERHARRREEEGSDIGLGGGVEC